MPTPLGTAIINRNVNEVTRLLGNIARLSVDDKRQAINKQDEDGNTALHYATQMGSVTFITAILAQKPDVDLQNDNGDTPLHLLLQGASDSLNYALDAPILAPSRLLPLPGENDHNTQPQQQVAGPVTDDPRLNIDFTQSAILLMAQNPHTRLPNLLGYNAFDACQNNVPYRHILSVEGIRDAVMSNDTFNTIKPIR